MKKLFGRYLGRLLALLAFLVGAGGAMAQTNTVSGVTSALTSSLGSAYDTAVAIGVLAVGIGLVVYLIKKGVKVRG